MGFERFDQESEVQKGYLRNSMCQKTVRGDSKIGAQILAGYCNNTEERSSRPKTEYWCYCSGSPHISKSRISSPVLKCSCPPIYYYYTFDQRLMPINSNLYSACYVKLVNGNLGSSKLKYRHDTIVNYSSISDDSTNHST